MEPEASSYPLGRLNCDPPVALLRSVMEHMAHVSAEMAKKGPGRPDFLLFTGDLVGIFVDDCFPDPWLHLPESEFKKKMLISQQRVDNFEGVFTLSAIFLGRNCSFATF